ncbi:MAG TPA: hypothetical protein VGX28_04820 [Frankiaceae bacterium]|jgi:hypothetical protein|nr:hypothetical protein [Frankiaceae bacterium]
MTTARETAGTAVQEAGTVAGAARDEAATVATTAADQARTVAQAATEATGQVVGEAARQARDLVGEATQQVRTQAETQTARLAENVRSIAGQLTSMASSAQEQGPATEVAQQLADKVQSLAGYLEGQTPEALLGDLRTYARRRPGLFLLGAGAVGFLAGRMIKGATAPSDTGAGGVAFAGETNPAGTGAWTGADTTYAGTATGQPVSGIELGDGTPTVTPAVPTFTEPYPTTGGGLGGSDVAAGSGMRTPGIGDGYGNG